MNQKLAILFRFLIIVVLIIGLQEFLSGLLPDRNVQVSAASDPVIAAAGDIACDPANSNFNNGDGTSVNCRQLDTSNLLVNAGLDAVLALGDVQYYCGSLQAFMESYDLSWGRIKSITYPVVGNHEYLTHGGTTGSTGCDASNAGAAGYFQYYGSAAGTAGQGYYSFDMGAWHLIALNSNCGDAGGCGPSSDQYKWLQADLAAHPNQCILAYWHIPLFSSGGRAALNSQQFWNLLYASHADVILNGHDHIYERFAPQDPTGVADPNGMREFIVGTGGSDHTSIVSVAANSEVRNTSTYGVLQMTLHSASYDWQFIPEAGGMFTDSGSAACHQGMTGGTATPTPTETLTSSPKNTKTPTPTSTETDTPTPRNTKTPTPTSTATNSPTPTFTDPPTFTPTPTKTLTPTSTPKLIPPPLFKVYIPLIIH